LQVAYVPSFVEGSSAGESKSDRLQRMKTRISQMERDTRNVHAMAAIIKKKGEIALDAKRYALSNLQKATDSINCKCLILSLRKKILPSLMIFLQSCSPPIIALNLSEENK
jgi:hypothetical protein